MVWSPTPLRYTGCCVPSMLMSIIRTGLASSIDWWYRPQTITNTIPYHVVPICVNGGAHWCQYTFLRATERMVVSSVWWQKYIKQVVTAHMHHQQPTETQYFGINIIKWNIYYIQQSTINGEQYTHTGRTTIHTQAEQHFTTWAEQHFTHKPNYIHLLGLTTKHSSFGITKVWM